LTDLSQGILENYNDIEIISLDVLKSKPKMIKEIKNRANFCESMIIDNTNIDVKTRSELINLVKHINNTYFVRIILVDTSFERCIHNNYYRYYVNHMNDPKLVPEFVFRMMRAKFVKPSKDENGLIDLIETYVPTFVPPDKEYLGYYY